VRTGYTTRRAGMGMFGWLLVRTADGQSFLGNAFVTATTRQKPDKHFYNTYTNAFSKKKKER
jgi:hypothetical protein